MFLAAVVTASLTIASPALATSNGVMAWGVNESGELGDGTLTSSDVPLTLSEPNGVVAVSAGYDFSLALLENDTVMAWGSNYSGELGDGTESGPEKCGGFACSKYPVAVSDLSEVTAIAAGGAHSLALLKNGKVMAWGDNTSGDLGDGGGSESDVPVAVSGLSEVTAIAAGGNHSLALLKNGKVMAWGENSEGQLGDGSTSDSDVPVAVSGLSEVVAISAGGHDSLALLKNGKVMAWGSNQRGELGNGTTENQDEPVLVTGLTEEVTAISAGWEHNLALLADGEVMAWGENSSGELGDGSPDGPEKCASAACSKTAVAVSGLKKVTAVSAGAGFSLALVENGTVKAWGNNFGQLGDGTTEDKEVPVLVSEIVEGVVGISAGGTFSLAYGSPGPIVTNLNPTSGSESGGTTVEIFGENFNEVSAVKFGTKNASSYEVVSPTEIKAKSPSGHGTVDITVTTLTGAIHKSHSNSRARFKYTP